MNKKNIILCILVLIIIVGIIIFVFLQGDNKKVENNTENTLNNTNVENDVENTLNNINIDSENNEGEIANMNEFMSKINININGTNYTATLEDNSTTRELIKKIPLEINMTELNGNEKYYYFDNSFPTNTTKIDKINNGDIMLYGNNCLVIFYDSFNTSYSYTRIGRIDNPSDLKNSLGNGNIIVTITK